MNLLNLVQQAQQLGQFEQPSHTTNTSVVEPAMQYTTGPASTSELTPHHFYPFVHLHTHSCEGSPGDALSSSVHLAAQAKALGQPALAITDHGSVSAWWKFNAACQQHGIKPIFGCEFYLAEGNKADNRDTLTGKRAYHLTLLAVNNTGRNNIIRLNNIAHRDGFYYRPRIDIEDLSRHSSGVLCLSGCVSGVIAQSFLSGRAALAEQWAGRFRGIFGAEHFFLEMQGHALPAQQELNLELLALARHMSLPLVATNDVHYTLADQSETHDTLICIKRNDCALIGREKRYAPRQFFLRSGDEMAGLFDGRPDVITNSLTIAERCTADLNLGVTLMPGFDPPAGRSCESYLGELARTSLQNMELQGNASYVTRLNSELEVIISLGFAPYFLLVTELVQWAKGQGIAVGPGRGSVVGSLVAFVLGITGIDPIQCGLMFERFLMPGRVTLPDIDLDFEHERRGEVINHLAERYQVLPILTRNMLRAKGSLRDAGRALNVPLPVVEQFASKVEQDDDRASFKHFLDQNAGLDPTKGRWLHDAAGLFDTARTLGRHASGLLLLEKSTDISLIPVERTSNDIVAAWDMDDVTNVQGLKLDVLGLSTLSVLKNIQAHAGINASAPELISTRARDVFMTLAQGRTTGVFQLESPGMQRLLRQIQPICFEDIIATVSLYRPGSLQSGQAELFVRARQGAPTPHSDSRVEGILRTTRGVIVYQEQIMQLAKHVGGFSDQEADALRKVVAKKEPEKMKPILDRFVAGAIQNGVSQRDAFELAAIIEQFGGYGFNKSHAAAYSCIAWWMAAYKTFYPAHFWAARLSVAPEGQKANERFEDYLRAAASDGAAVIAPSLNHSFDKFCVEGNGVRFGLSGIKGIGAETALRVIQERTSNGPYPTLKSIYSRLAGGRVCNVSVLTTLAKCGALDEFGSSRSRIAEELNYYHKHRSRKSAPPPLTPTASPESAWDRILQEYELLGLPLGTSTATVFPPEAILDFSQIPNAVQATIGGRIGSVEERLAKNGNPFLRISIEGPRNKVRAIAFSDCLQSCPDCNGLKEGNFIVALGVYDVNYGTFKLNYLQLAKI